MTTIIKRGETFRGVPAGQLREVLSAWLRDYRNIGDIALLSKAPDDKRQVLGVLQEAADAGMLGMVVKEDSSPYSSGNASTPKMCLTVAGLAVVAASMVKRMEKAKAAKLLDGLLRNAAAINADPKAPVSVDEIWIFGSMVDEARNDVGDIDFVVVTSRREVVAMNWNWVEAMEAYVRTHYPGMLPEGFDRIRESSEDVFLARSLYGKRRHPMFAPNQMHTLKDLHRPCRLVFDASRGGRVDDPVLPHHPDSKSRAKTIKPRLRMPELSKVRGGFLPTSIGWLSSDDGSWLARPELAAPFSYGFPPDYESRDDRSRETFDLDFGVGRRRCVVRVARSIKAVGKTWSYVCRVEVVSCPSRRGLSEEDIERLGRLLDDLVGADAFRMAGRRDDLGRVAMIDIEMQVKADAGAAYYGDLCDRVYESLEKIVLGNKVIPDGCCFSLECHTEDEEHFIGYLTPEEEAEMDAAGQ